MAADPFAQHRGGKPDHGDAAVESFDRRQGGGVPRPCGGEPLAEALKGFVAEILLRQGCCMASTQDPGADGARSGAQACRAGTGAGAASRKDWTSALHAVTVFVTPRNTSMDDAKRFGFVAFAETWNGRLAMLGFLIGLGTELLTGQGILSQIGLG